MNVRLILGILLFGLGLIGAAVGIMAVGHGDSRSMAETAGNSSAVLAERLNSYAIPVMAGLLLAGGGVLMGLSLGNWQRPRTRLEPGDAVVDPEGYHKMKHV